MKKLLKLAMLVQAARHSHGAGYDKPWKAKKKWKSRGPYAHGPHNYPPHGLGRPQGLKGMLVEAIARRLLRR